MYPFLSSAVSTGTGSFTFFPFFSRCGRGNVCVYFIPSWLPSWAAACLKHPSVRHVLPFNVSFVLRSLGGLEARLGGGTRHRWHTHQHRLISHPKHRLCSMLPWSYVPYLLKSLCPHPTPSLTGALFFVFNTLAQPPRGPPAAAAGLRGHARGALPRQPLLPGAAPALPPAVPQGRERPHRSGGVGDLQTGSWRFFSFST